MTKLKPNQKPSLKPVAKGQKNISRVFWLAFLVLSLAAAWYCFYAPSNDVAWSTDFTEAQREAIESDQPMILFFTATWCSPCRIMKRTVWADEQVANEVNKRFVPLMLYADDPKMTDVFKRYDVNVTPITIITDSQGNALDWVSGSMRKEDFLQFIQKNTGPLEN